MASSSAAPVFGLMCSTSPSLELCGRPPCNSYRFISGSISPSPAFVGQLLFASFRPWGCFNEPFAKVRWLPPPAAARARVAFQPAHHWSYLPGPPAAAVASGIFRPTYLRGHVAGLPAAAIVRGEARPAHRRGCVADLSAAVRVRVLLQSAHRRGCVADVSATAIVRGGVQPAYRRGCVASFPEACCRSNARTLRRRSSNKLARLCGWDIHVI